MKTIEINAPINVNTPSLRMYVDENGNPHLRGDLTNNNNRFLCLTGVVMQLTTHDVLEKRFNELKRRCFGTADIVLHRREIISAQKPFEALKDESVRNTFNKGNQTQGKKR